MRLQGDHVEAVVGVVVPGGERQGRREEGCLSGGLFGHPEVLRRRRHHLAAGDREDEEAADDGRQQQTPDAHQKRQAEEEEEATYVEADRVARDQGASEAEEQHALCLPLGIAGKAHEEVAHHAVTDEQQHRAEVVHVGAALVEDHAHQDPREEHRREIEEGAQVTAADRRARDQLGDQEHGAYDHRDRVGEDGGGGRQHGQNGVPVGEQYHGGHHQGHGKQEWVLPVG